MSIGSIPENLENKQELKQELPTCPYCGTIGIRCKFCFVGWMVRFGFYKDTKGIKHQRWRCKQCKKTISL